MNLLNRTIDCPFCGHATHLTVEVTDNDQDYTEDCSNCCNPIHIRVHKDQLHRTVQLFIDADNEQYY